MRKVKGFWLGLVLAPVSLFLIATEPVQAQRLHRHETAPPVIVPAPGCAPQVLPGTVAPPTVAPTPGAPGTTTVVPTPGAPGTTPATPTPGTPATTTPSPFSAMPAGQEAGVGAPGSFNPTMMGDLGSGGYYRAIHGGSGSGLVPLSILGAFKIAENESPRPLDRLFINYNFYSQVPAGTGDGKEFGNLHRETFGFEKTLLNGSASIGLRVPFMQQTGFASDDVNFNDFGNLTIIGKYALLNDAITGDVLSGGLAVTVPTGRNAVLYDDHKLNGTLLQPYVGFIFNLDKLYVHGFGAVVVPTDSREVILLTNDLGVGYRLMHDESNQRLITAITPTFEAHLTDPLNHRGINNSSDVVFSDILVLTSGLHIDTGPRCRTSLGVAVPVTGPKPFDVEAIAQFNLRF